VPVAGIDGEEDAAGCTPECARRGAGRRLGLAQPGGLAALPEPALGRIALKVINRLGDEMMKVFKVT
jgi:hypothetical protein